MIRDQPKLWHFTSVGPGNNQKKSAPAAIDVVPYPCYGALCKCTIFSSRCQDENWGGPSRINTNLHPSLSSVLSINSMPTHFVLDFAHKSFLNNQNFRILLKFVEDDPLKNSAPPLQIDCFFSVLSLKTGRPALWLKERSTNIWVQEHLVDNLT